MDRDLALADLAVPDHLVHICPRGSQCPATEPAETGLGQPWPPVHSDPDAGDGVTVVVIDGGWFDPTTEPSFASAPLPWSWLGNVTGEPEPHGIRHPQTTQLRPYAGHGTFVAGVVRAMAPKCTVHVLSLPVDPNTPGRWRPRVGHGRPARRRPRADPQLINLSAGCPTRDGAPARAFENWWADVSAATPDRDLVFVAAAGNNSSPGSSGRRRSTGPWESARSTGTAACRTSPTGATPSTSSRWVATSSTPSPTAPTSATRAPTAATSGSSTAWLARWSGTSFSAPLVTGMIAAAMTGHIRAMERAGGP